VATKTYWPAGWTGSGVKLAVAVGAPLAAGGPGTTCTTPELVVVTSSPGTQVGNPAPGALRYRVKETLSVRGGPPGTPVTVAVSLKMPPASSVCGEAWVTMVVGASRTVMIEEVPGMLKAGTVAGGGVGLGAEASTKDTAKVLPSMGRCSTSKVKSMMQVVVGPPVVTGARTTGPVGVKVTVPLALGGDTENRRPAHAVPARPVAMGSMSKMGPGTARGSGEVQGSAPTAVPALVHDGFIRMLVMVTGTVLRLPTELLVMAMMPGWSWAPTVTLAGNAGPEETMIAFTWASAGSATTVMDATVDATTSAKRSDADQRGPDRFPRCLAGCA
jgi:hypothetical protein